MQYECQKFPAGLPYNLFVPARRIHPNIVVLVHGVRTEPAKMLHAVQPIAARYGATVMVPEFSRPTFNGYQRLAGKGGPFCASKALLAAVADAQEKLGIGSGRIDLVGFSGGGQFAHRFAMFHPAHVCSAVVASAGWYTYLDSERPYPYGIALGQCCNRESAIVAEFLKLPVLVAVGERDLKRDHNFRTGSDIDAHQGGNRVERARKWVEHTARRAAMMGIKPRVEFATLPKTGHSFDQAMNRGRLGELMFRFLDDAQKETPRGVSVFTPLEATLSDA